MIFFRHENPKEPKSVFSGLAISLTNIFLVLTSLPRLPRVGNRSVYWDEASSNEMLQQNDRISTRQSKSLTSRLQNICRSKRVLWWLTLPHGTSLDVFLIVSLWAYAIHGDLVGKSIKSSLFIVVGACVWVGYCVDRLFDSRQLKIDEVHTVRHGFCQRYWFFLVFLVCLVCLAVGIWATLFFDHHTILYGGGLSLLAFVYLVYVQRLHPQKKWIQKEALASLLVAASVCLPSLLYDSLTMRLPVTFLLVWGVFSLNCYSVAQIERRSDVAQGFRSWVSSETLGHQFIWRMFIIQSVTTLVFLSIGQVTSGVAGLVLISQMLLMINWCVFRGPPDANPEGLPEFTMLGSAFADIYLIIPAAFYVVLI